MSTHPATCLIPLTSGEALWEWDIVSDALFLSMGARSLLMLHPAPMRMAHFLKHIPSHALPRLCQLREGVLSGLAGSSLQCDYPFKDLQLQEQMLILSRCENGRATKAIGRYDALSPRSVARGESTAGTLQRSESAWPSVACIPHEGHLSHALEAVGDGLWEWDVQNNLIHYNSRYLAILGYAREQFPSTINSWKEKIHPDDYEKVANSHLVMIASPRKGDSIECTYRMRRADGGWVWLFGRGCVTRRDADGRACYMVGFITNITTVQSERDKLEEQAKNDALTGLSSRSHCNLEIQRIEREGIRPVCVIYSDITGLKMINDNLGHTAGDAVLAEAAVLLRQPLRASDCVARMGGDEFVVLLPHCTPGEGLKKLKAIEENFSRRNRHSRRLPILASFGLAHSDSLDVPLSDILIQADMCMLRQKKAHRESAQKRLRNWIKAHTGECVSGDDRLINN